MHETEKLIGLHRELFYVRDGVFNQGAIDFNIPVSNDIEYLHFLWWNADYTSKVDYKIKVQVLNNEIMLQPSLNISHSDKVPNAPTYWRMSLPCQHFASGKAAFEIQIELNGGEESKKNFKLIREKQCESGISDNDSMTPFHSMKSSVSSHAVFVYSSLIAFLISICLTIFVSFMQKKTRESLQENLPLKNEDPSPLLPPIEPSTFSAPNAGFSVYDGGITSDAESRVTNWIQEQYMKRGNQQQQTKSDESVIDTSRTPEEVAKDLEIERSRLKLGSLLQEGTFGKVYQGRYLITADDEVEEEDDVMIKTVMSWSSTTQSELLVIEAVKLSGLNHNHILSPWCMTWDGSSPMFIYPYSSQGNLKQYLTILAKAGLSTHQIVKYGIQLLSAIGHMHKRKIIHKDIATRNCYLGENQTLKLSDSALSKDLFPSDYHCLGDNDNRPIKWLPVEAIVHNKYSRASDVWSFGVFMWEVATKAQQPFSEVDPFEIEDYLTGGYRLHQPLNCPDQLYSVLVSCWGSQPQERASVQQLYQALQELQKQLQQFV